VLEIEFIGDWNTYFIERNCNGIKVLKEQTYGPIRRRRMGQVMEEVREGGKSWREIDTEKPVDKVKLIEVFKPSIRKTENNNK